MLKQKILIPPLEEQKQIAYILKTIDRKIEIGERRKYLLRAIQNHAQQTCDRDKSG